MTHILEGEGLRSGLAEAEGWGRGSSKREGKADKSASAADI
jgi:hypothetical protein